MEKSFSRITLWLGHIYLALLAGTIIYGNLKYGFLRDIHPNQSLTNPLGASKWFSAYGQFLDFSIIVLALLLGIWTALWGLMRKSYLLGIGSLVTGIVITTLGYALLPRLYFLGGDLIVECRMPLQI